MARRSAVRAHAPTHTPRLPRRLPAGGTIGIAAPAGVVDPERLAAGEASLRAAGFEIAPTGRPPGTRRLPCRRRCPACRRADGAGGRPFRARHRCAQEAATAATASCRGSTPAVCARPASRWSATAMSRPCCSGSFAARALSDSMGPCWSARAGWIPTGSAPSLRSSRAADPHPWCCRATAGSGGRAEGTARGRQPGNAGGEPRHAVGDRDRGRDPHLRGGGRAALPDRSHAASSCWPQESSKGGRDRGRTSGRLRAGPLALRGRRST